MKVLKRDGSVERFSKTKIRKSLMKTFKSCKVKFCQECYDDAIRYIVDKYNSIEGDILDVETIQDITENALYKCNMPDAAKSYILYRHDKDRIREFVKQKEKFIEEYKKSYNTADSTIDDNSNVANKNIGVLNAEIHKADNIQINRTMVTNKVHELYPDFDHKQYCRDLLDHIIYKNDESSFACISPYCVAITMYPFLLNGMHDLGGLSARPKNLDSYCGMLVNLVFALSSQFAGAVALPEALLCFDYFARKEWGDEYIDHIDESCKSGFCVTQRSVGEQIHQYFQQIVYSINQPASARGMQSAFVNFSYYDESFFHGMFDDFVFPDGTKPIWRTLNWLQKEFMQWFNAERLKCILTFPVESFALIQKDGEFLDADNYKFVCDEYSRGHSFFTYISDSVDSLSSCCRLKNKLTTKEFNFTNGNAGVMTGSKSVISLNLSRIVQNATKDFDNPKDLLEKDSIYDAIKRYLIEVLDRVYKYQNAYNELLWDMYDAKLLPAYNAGFITLDKQYLTIGLNGLNQAAEYLGLECSKNKRYSEFCHMIFGTVKEQNALHKTKHTMFNTEQVPAESLAVKNYNWDKEDGYWVPDDTNLYASYIFKPNDPKISVLDKIEMHGNDYIGDYLDGGSAAHINLSEHLSPAQYDVLLKHAAKTGCSYLTFNVPNSECADCGWIGKTPVDVCPKCGSVNINYWDRIIGYLTKINNWSEGRRIEQKTRVYTKKDKI